MDWAAAMISAQQTLREASDLLAKVPHGNRAGIAANHAEASALVESAMVQMARILSYLQRDDA